MLAVHFVTSPDPYQVKLFPYVSWGMYLFLTRANTFENIYSKVVVFNIIETTFDNLPQIEILSSPGL